MSSLTLRTAILVKGLPLHRPGGQENHAWTLARGLAARGHHVTLVTTAAPGGAAERHVDGVRVVHLSGTTPGENSWAFFHRAAAWVRVFDGEFDVFHAQGFAALLARPRRTPLVSTVHGTVWSETPLARQVRPLLPMRERLAALWRFRARTLLGPLVHRQWARSGRLICDSAFTRGELLRLHPAWAGRIDLVPLGVELPCAVPARDGDLRGRPIRLLTVGRLERVKGLDDLLQALALVPDPRRFELEIVGDGPHRAALERAAAARGLGARVRFRGRVDDEALAEAWRWADLFVNPEWSQPAFGLASLEALGWGLPVLGTQTGATPEVVSPDVGWLVPPARPEALAETLARLAAEPELIAARRLPARCRAEQFSVAAMVDGTVGAYRRAGRGD